MIQTSIAALAPLEIAEEQRPSIWGLDAVQLHDAYWRSCGVQCIRRGQPQKLQSGADLFLLMEPDQLVLFDLHAMAERLAWRAAAITRLRVMGQSEEAYGEHVEIDDARLVRRITRRYRPQTHATYRVLLTRRRRIARIWMGGDVRRNAWKRIRRMVKASNIDTCHCPGGCYTPNRAADEKRMIERMVEAWKTPGLALKGIHEAAEGVWTLRGEELHEESIVIGPAWIGSGRAGGFSQGEKAQKHP
jgi:hypothetical protein